MEKVRAEPDSAMILSKDGKRMAIRMMTRMVEIRMRSLKKPRVLPGRPVKVEAGGRDSGVKPRRCSNVTTIGRALWIVMYKKRLKLISWGERGGRNKQERDIAYFRGIFVKGIMAINTTMRTERDWG